MKKIFGFDKIEEKLLNDFKNNKLHHCNIINGLKGTGKSSFIFNFSSIILSQKNDEFIDDKKIFEKTFKLIEARSHPELLLIDIFTLDEKDKENTGKSGEISVSQVRKIIKSINLTNSISKNKVLIIDSIDEININGQNALLKTLEEPPQNTYIFLICHNLDKVLHTIRSRSNIYTINDLNFSNWMNGLLANNIENFTLTEGDFYDLYDFSNSSIAIALKILETNSLNMYENILKILVNKNIIEIQNLASQIDKNNLLDIFDLFLENIFEKLRNLLFGKLDNIKLEYKENLTKIVEKISVEDYLKEYNFYKKIILDIDTFNLSKIHCINVLLNKLFS